MKENAWCVEKQSKGWGVRTIRSSQSVPIWRFTSCAAASACHTATEWVENLDSAPQGLWDTLCNKSAPRFRHLGMKWVTEKRVLGLKCEWILRTVLQLLHSSRPAAEQHHSELETCLPGTLTVSLPFSHSLLAFLPCVLHILCFCMVLILIILIYFMSQGLDQISPRFSMLQRSDPVF